MSENLFSFEDDANVVVVEKVQEQVAPVIEPYVPIQLAELPADYVSQLVLSPMFFVGIGLIAFMAIMTVMLLIKKHNDDINAVKSYEELKRNGFRDEASIRAHDEHMKNLGYR